MQEKSVSNVTKTPNEGASFWREIMTHFVLPLVRLSPGWSGISRHVWQAVGAVAMALRVRSERRALAGLDERSLKDIGYTQSAACAEAQRRLWDVPAERLSA